MTTDHLNTQADSLVDLAFVLEAAGSPGEASAALERAAEIYEAKGNTVRAREARAQLARRVRV